MQCPFLNCRSCRFLNPRNHGQTCMKLDQSAPLRQRRGGGTISSHFNVHPVKVIIIGVHLSSEVCNWGWRCFTSKLGGAGDRFGDYLYVDDANLIWVRGHNQPTNWNTRFPRPNRKISKSTYKQKTEAARREDTLLLKICPPTDEHLTAFQNYGYVPRKNWISGYMSEPGFWQLAR